MNMEVSDFFNIRARLKDVVKVRRKKCLLLTNAENEKTLQREKGVPDVTKRRILVQQARLKSIN